MSREAAEKAVREGDLDAALKYLQEQIRKEPARSDLRVFLFQLLAVLGQWERALTQLNVAAELDPAALAMAQMYREAIRCEVLRADVFAGKKVPLVFGEPERWLALLIESLLKAEAAPSQSQELRAQAFEEAPTSLGMLDASAFEWIADADMRLGPVCEAIMNGRYYWVPFSRLTAVTLEAPADLRDVVWMPAHFQFANGGESVGVIPTRYPGSEKAGDAHVALARKTVWREDAPEVFTGLGQRVLSTNTGEHALMDIRSMTIVPSAAASETTGG